MKIASIDIGTNTCNLVIAKLSKNYKLEIIHKEKKSIRLIDEYYKDSCISKNAINRSFKVVKSFKQIAENNNVEKIIAITTSGIRNAINKDEIINKFNSELGLNIKVIDGKEEARLTYVGVKNAINLDRHPKMLIDIGGGSVEFVICNNEKILWMESYDIGIARLLTDYQFSDPITSKNIDFLINFFNKTLKTVFSKSIEYEIKTLIGCSGSFDTFKNLSICANPENIPTKSKTYFIISLEEFYNIHNDVVNKNIFERIEMKGMDPIRVEMIPIASVLTKFLLEKLDIEQLVQSSYSLKEGVIIDNVNLIT